MSILPQPKKWRKGRDLVAVDRGLKIRRPPKLFKSNVGEQNRLLENALADFLGELGGGGSSRRKALKTLELAVVDELTDGAAGRPGPEAYQLDISRDGIRLTGTDGLALRAGLLTLTQMLVRRGDACLLPTGQVIDWPDLPLRGFHLDLVCQSLWFDYVCGLLERMAAYKYNAVLIEWGDKFPYQGHQVLVHPDAFSPRQVGQLLGLADRLGIVVIPLVQTLGHVEFILRHPQFAHLAEVPGDVYQLATGNPESLVLAKQLVDQLIESHPNSPYIHLGADEPTQLGQGVSADQVRRKGKSLAWMEYMNVICRHVQARGRTPIVWDDALLAHPEAIHRFTRDCLLMHWHYNITRPVQSEFWQPGLGGINAAKFKQMDADLRARNEPYWSRHGARPPKSFYTLASVPYLQDAGFRVIVAPAVRSMGDGYSSPRLRYHLDNCRTLAAGAAANRSLGLMATNWSVRRTPIETTVPGLLAAAEAAWNASARADKGFESRLAEHLAAPGRPDLIQILESVGRSGLALFNGVGAGGGWDRRHNRWTIAPLVGRLRKAELEGLTASSEPVRLARKVLGDARAALNKLARLSNGPAMHATFLPAWRYAARETAHKAAQWLFLWQLARLARVDRGSAQALARQGAALLDELRRCQREFKKVVGPTLTAPGFEEEVDLHFGGEARLLRRAVKALRARGTRDQLRNQLAEILGMPAPDESGPSATG